MNSYSLMHERVPLIEIGGRNVVIDTGSPSSFPGNQRVVAREYGDLWQRIRETVMNQTGEFPDELWGTDKLSTTTVQIDLPNQKMSLGETKNIAEACVTLESELVHGVPVIHVKLGGKDLRLVLDTGCHHGYVLHAEELQSTGMQMADHSPHVDGGNFTAPTYRGELLLKTENGTALTCGIVEFGYVAGVEKLRELLEFFGVDGVVGGNVFRRYVIEFRDEMQAIKVVPGTS